jgi:hypothetical protein
VSVAGGTPARAKEYTTMGNCPRCREYVRGRHIRTVDERHALVEHDDCPGKPPPEARVRTFNG